MKTILRISLISIIGLTSCNNVNNKINKEEIPLLIITDIGRDVDDAQAFAFLAEQINGKTEILNIIGNKKGKKIKHNGINPVIAGVICTGYIPEVRAKTLANFMQLYGINNLPIAIPTTPEKDLTQIEEYYNTHLVDNKPYELTLLNELNKNGEANVNFTTPDKMIEDLNNEYGNKLRVVIIAQPTQFTQALESLNKKGIKPQFNSIYIQGQYKILDSIMVPDFSAYNLREDSLSSFELFNLQDSVPFVFLSKYATYPYALSKAETEQIKKKANGGEYLYSAAVNGLKSFLERDSALFYNIFKVNPSINKNNAIDSLKVLNNPYDLLTTISIFYPEIFVADTLELNNIKHINIIR